MRRRLNFAEIALVFLGAEADIAVGITNPTTDSKKPVVPTKPYIYIHERQNIYKLGNTLL